MIYTILFAESDAHVVSLDKHGNRFDVSVWSKLHHFTVEQSCHDVYEEAEDIFRKRVKDYRCGDIREAHPEMVNVD